MVDLLLDTNVLIYLHGQHPTYLDFSRTVIGKILGISVVSSMEMLVGAKNESQQASIASFLDHFEEVPVSPAIARQAALRMRSEKRKSLRHPLLADTLIGQTALMLGVPLVTNNPKDFAAFKGLSVIVPGS